MINFQVCKMIKAVNNSDMSYTDKAAVLDAITAVTDWDKRSANEACEIRSKIIRLLDDEQRPMRIKDIFVGIDCSYNIQYLTYQLGKSYSIGIVTRFEKPADFSIEIRPGYIKIPMIAYYEIA